MIESVIESSIRNRYLVMILAAALTVWGVYAVLDTPMDAIPDLSENQVIVFTDWMGRSPREIEDQVTYPLSLKLQGLAGVKTVRSSSEFNFSMITVIFGENIDFYFARQRVLEKLTLASTFLPQGVVPYLAPDATALGQIFWYNLEGGGLDPGRLWALQRYYVGPEINSVPGVAEVGTVGGFPQEYQIDVDPMALRAYGLTLGELYEAVARSNASVGGRVIQKNNAEYLVRGVGWIESTRDLENTVVKSRNGIPIYVRNVARVALGTQFRRSVFEKDGNEVIGAVVVMRYGENPLAVTQRVKRKILELQAGLPEGVHIVPAYDRTRLIHGAIHTLTEVMWHEMAIAGLAILLILMHVRSVFVICVTLPLSVLFSFLQMWILRKLDIVNVQANIMSLAGITISIGILVDQAIVMVENATHHLKARFGDRPVTGDTREIVIAACRTVGRPIFFSVLIILISFIPVFAMSGREGKLFHPMAFTKSLAMIGVAIISVTLVPALIPAFIKGRLRSEEDNWIVRSFINIYRPLLTWALPKRNLVMWAFAALLILAAGMFPMQALIGQGSGHHQWQTMFLATLGVVITLTVVFVDGWQRQFLALVTLVILGLTAYHFPKIGVEFMPPLNEGTDMDMPTAPPRVSITQAADDLKARDAVLRGFPEVESVIGKAGRADTPTDPAPLEMVESFVNYRPIEQWPRRTLKFEDALRHMRFLLGELESRGYVTPGATDDREALLNDATMNALSQFDDALRSLAAQRYVDFERDLAPILTRCAVEETLRLFQQRDVLHWPETARPQDEIDALANALTPLYGRWLAKNPAPEDVGKIAQETARHLVSLRALLRRDPKTEDTDHWEEIDAAQALDATGTIWQTVRDQAKQFFGREPATFSSLVLDAVRKRREQLWHEFIRQQVNPELFYRGVEAFTWAGLEELGRSAQSRNLLADSESGVGLAEFLTAVARGRNGKDFDAAALRPFIALRQELEKPFAARLILWRRQAGPKGNLRQEIDTVVQVPGWSNIWTQPIINRVDMLSTGVRTPIGVKVFGPDLQSIVHASKQIETAIKGVNGAGSVIAEPIMGKGYLEIKIDREKAARYGVSIGDIQDTIEVALGGRIITQTVEGRDRFPVRVRYARDFRDDELAVRRLLVSANGMATQAAAGVGMAESAGPPALHQDTSPHAALGTPLQIPLSDVADVRIVEGPAMIKSENGRLRNYVTVTLTGNRDIVGFVDEAQRVVADTVQLPEGVHVEWSGEFEHQVRAARTLRIIFPCVVLLIFLILYWTYHDVVDACLMMLAVPEALAGGVFFQFLFPKIMNGWDAPPVDFSVAIWVGYIAAFGMATETGIIMLVYLREAIDKRGGLENIRSLDELREAVIEGAVHRLRPKLLTEGVAIVAIAPMLFATGVGSEITSAMALPVLGGLLIADEVVDIFLPVRFYWVRRARWLKLHKNQADESEVSLMSRRLYAGGTLSTAGIKPTVR